MDREDRDRLVAAFLKRSDEELDDFHLILAEGAGCTVEDAKLILDWAYEEVLK
jgi:hypothetical protein